MPAFKRHDSLARDRFGRMPSASVNTDLFLCSAWRDRSLKYKGVALKPGLPIPYQPAGGQS